MHDPDPDLDPGHPTAERLRAFAHGSVEASEQERVTAHLAECADCCAALDDLTPRDALVTRLRDAAGQDQSGREADSARQSAVRALRRGQWREAVTPRPPERTAPGSHATLLPDPPATTPVWQVGAYDLLGEVGRGGMGVVYKARHRELNRVVALKMVLAGEFASASQRLRFRREAELAARVRHAHIVQVYEVGQVGDRPYLAMEWVEGGTLADRLDGTPWPAHPAAHLVGTLARAIDAAHRQGVIHRDLKPANILVQPAEEDDSGGVRSGRDRASAPDGLVPIPPLQPLQKWKRVLAGGTRDLEKCQHYGTVGQLLVQHETPAIHRFQFEVGRFRAHGQCRHRSSSGLSFQDTLQPAHRAPP